MSVCNSSVLQHCMDSMYQNDYSDDRRSQSEPQPLKNLSPVFAEVPSTAQVRASPFVEPQKTPLTYEDISMDEDNEDGDDDNNDTNEAPQGSPISESDASSESANIPETYSGVNRKRCRFAPRQDVELMKELCGTDDKPFARSGKAAWTSWAKISETLNEKQIFGPMLKLSAITCKLRFEFLIKNAQGRALQYNPKRGNVDEFRQRDELIAQLAPMMVDGVVATDGEPTKRLRGRPRKRQRVADSEVEEDFCGSPSMPGSNSRIGISNQRKRGRPRKMAKNEAIFGGVGLEFLTNQSVSNGRTSLTDAINVHNHAQPVLGLPEGSVALMIVEYLKHHEDHQMAFKREKMLVFQQDKSEERRLQRDQVAVMKADLEVRKAEFMLAADKWKMELQQRQLKLKMLKQELDA